MAQTHELAARDYILGMKYREIAEKYNVSVDTVKSWKTRHKWERNKPVKKTAHNAHKNKKVCKGVQKDDEPREELTDREQLFCYHYVRTWNATQAVLLAGYGNSNKASAKAFGFSLLQRPRVKQEIDRLRTLFRQELHVDIQDFLEFCLKVVGADIGDYIAFGRKEVPVLGMYGPMMIEDETKEPVECHDKDGKPKMVRPKKPLMQTVNAIDLGESNMLDTSVISEIKQGRDGVSIKLADKKWAWEQLIKYFDWLPDKWQRKITEDEQRAKLEKMKAETAKIRGDGDDDEDGTDNFRDALSGKVPEVWGDGSEDSSV